MGQYAKEYYRKNRDVIRAKEKIRWKNKTKSNKESRKVKVKVRKYVLARIKIGYLAYISRNIEDHIGIEMNGFIEWIESFFTDGMSWDNYGKWHIDHVIPLASAKSIKQLRVLNNYKNLRPMWALDNIKKGGKL